MRRLSCAAPDLTEAVRTPSITRIASRRLSIGVGAVWAGCITVCAGCGTVWAAAAALVASTAAVTNIPDFMGLLATSDSSPGACRQAVDAERHPTPPCYRRR